MKISFDFDSTLSKPKIQNLCMKLLKKEHDIWIVTSRCLEGYGINYDNNDLYRVASELGIDNNKIHFTNANYKDEFLINNNFAIHFDDDKFEIEKLQNTSVIGINVTESFWLNKVRESLEI